MKLKIQVFGKCWVNEVELIEAVSLAWNSKDNCGYIIWKLQFCFLFIILKKKITIFYGTRGKEMCDTKINFSYQKKKMYNNSHENETNFDSPFKLKLNCISLHRPDHFEWKIYCEDYTYHCTNIYKLKISIFFCTIIYI